MKNRETNWHSLSADAVLEALDVKPKQGLSEKKVLLRLNEYGANKLTPRRGEKSPAIAVIAISSASDLHSVDFSRYHRVFAGMVDSSVIFGVVIVNAIIGFTQEANALKAIDALSRALSISATVLRDGGKRVIPAGDLVPGDLVVLQSGDKVPADLRLLNVRELRN